MVATAHKSKDYQINAQTETLIIGTFNPETPKNKADFFYGRIRNFLWKLLPTAFGEPSLKGSSKAEKVLFIQKMKIDFIDLISEIVVDDASNYNDEYLDNKEIVWRDVVSEIEKLPNIKRVCFTRKSFSGIPNMKFRISEIQKYCELKDVNFKCLITPARFYNAEKQREWTEFFIN